MSLLSSIMRGRSATIAADAEVRRILRGALDARERIELAPIRTLLPWARPLGSTIESIDEHGFVVGQPSNGRGPGRALNRFGLYAMTVSHGGRDFAGEVQVVGRAKVPSGGRGVVYGYRLTLPRALNVVERRWDLRLVLGGDLVREAEMTVLGRSGPILGLVEDLSANGAKLRCRNGNEDELVIGRNVTFRLTLAPPIGEIDETARVSGVERDRRGGGLVVCLRFDRRIEAIERMISDGPWRG